MVRENLGSYQHDSKSMSLDGTISEGWGTDEYAPPPPPGADMMGGRRRVYAAWDRLDWSRAR